MSAIGAFGSYGSMGGYYSILQNRNAHAAGPAGTEAVSPVSRAETAPVQPVSGVSPVRRGAAQAVPEQEQEGKFQFPTMRAGADPAELAVRARIRAWVADGRLPRAGEDGETTKSPREDMEEAECQTCKKRKYQDGSDDPGVSFKTATNVAPEQAAAAVRGHEQEHVVRERAKAQREDRRVVSQSVTIHTAICPECGDVYVSGGTTRTATRANPAEEPRQSEEEEKSGFQAFA